MPTTTTDKAALSSNGQTLTKRAFAYLRVSSDSQVNTGYSQDGLSIDSQREQARDKAAQLDAEIVREFADPGKSTYVDLHKRTAFLAMLDELAKRNRHPATHVDYVIVWSTSRWAAQRRGSLPHPQARPRGWRQAHLRH